MRSGELHAVHSHGEQLSEFMDYSALAFQIPDVEVSALVAGTEHVLVLAMAEAQRQHCRVMHDRVFALVEAEYSLRRLRESERVPELNESIVGAHSEQVPISREGHRVNDYFFKDLMLLELADRFVSLLFRFVLLLLLVVVVVVGYDDLRHAEARTDESLIFEAFEHQLQNAFWSLDLFVLRGNPFDKRIGEVLTELVFGASSFLVILLDFGQDWRLGLPVIISRERAHFF